jgi:hypothetical protein
MAARPSVTTSPVQKPSTVAPGTTSIARVTSTAFRAKPARPSVSTLSGRARRASTGQTSGQNTHQSRRGESGVRAVEREARQQLRKGEQRRRVQQEYDRTPAQY